MPNLVFFELEDAPKDFIDLETYVFLQIIKKDKNYTYLGVSSNKYEFFMDKKQPSQLPVIEADDKFIIKNIVEYK